MTETPAPQAEPSATGNTYAARDHARAQEAAAAATERAWVPAADHPGTPADIDPDKLVWAETVGGGGYAHQTLAPGTVVELTDLDGDACVHLALAWAGSPWERLCVADTLKVQWNAYLGQGSLLLSDQGRALATLVMDESGRHDAFCGAPTAAQNEARYGDGTPWGPTPAARELLKLAAAKHDLTARDLPQTVALFKGLKADAEGRLHWLGGSGPGRRVRLLAEAPLLVMLANTPHALDPREDYTVGPVRALAWRERPTGTGDARWDATPEGRRALANTAARIGAAA
ncbi:urea amidolyase associated protein UAAP1 [Glycomyces sp. NPDC048151]|uniref:urea amidolyase associated protein UAAP1 n=1 Tax=Glycomyces sp. NPDC048151 TaxID=3364002 RepID=UPI0037249ACB